MASLETVLAEPPRVHPNAPDGVWATHADCYRFLTKTVTAGMETLETGLGISTIVFALAGANHTSLFLDPEEGVRLLDYCREKGIDVDRLQLRPGNSDETLPALEPTPLDVVLIDGCHAFPFPQLDWFYAGGRLRKGGILVVDDLSLPAPFQLMSYLDADPRWGMLQRTGKWAAFERRSEGSLREEWRSQPFHGKLDYELTYLARRLRLKAVSFGRRVAAVRRR